MPEKILLDRASALLVLVDEDPDVSVTTGAFLEAAGFDVVRVPNGDAALACLHSNQTFVLLVTDYAMPELNGVHLAAVALARLPNLKVLIITDFPNEASLIEWPSKVALLVKPFRRAALIEQLKSLFAAERAILPTYSHLSNL